MRLRDLRALCIQRGVMLARNLKYARTTEPALDAKSLASLAIEFRLLMLQNTGTKYTLGRSLP